MAIKEHFSSLEENFAKMTSKYVLFVWLVIWVLPKYISNWQMFLASSLSMFVLLIIHILIMYLRVSFYACIHRSYQIDNYACCASYRSSHLQWESGDWGLLFWGARTYRNSWSLWRAFLPGFSRKLCALSHPDFTWDHSPCKFHLLRLYLPSSIPLPF